VALVSVIISIVVAVIIVIIAHIGVVVPVIVVRSGFAHLYLTGQDGVSALKDALHADGLAG